MLDPSGDCDFSLLVPLATKSEWKSKLDPTGDCDIDIVVGFRDLSIQGGNRSWTPSGDCDISMMVLGPPSLARVENPNGTLRGIATRSGQRSRSPKRRVEIEAGTLVKMEDGTRRTRTAEKRLVDPHFRVRLLTPHRRPPRTRVTSKWWAALVDFFLQILISLSLCDRGQILRRDGPAAVRAGRGAGAHSAGEGVQQAALVAFEFQGEPLGMSEEPRRARLLSHCWRSRAWMARWCRH